MNLWDRCLSKNHQTELTFLTEPELSLNARLEETPNRISSGFVLTEALLGMFLDLDRYFALFYSIAVKKSCFALFTPSKSTDTHAPCQAFYRYRELN